MHSNSRPHPASDATRREMRGKQDTSSNGLSKESYDSMDGREGRRVEKWDAIKLRTSQRLEYKPEIRLCYASRYNICICINVKSV
jgi:hypothetical protein